MKRFISVLVFTLLLVTLFTKSVAAQTQAQHSASPTPAPVTKTTTQTQYPLNVNADVPQNFHTYTQSVVLELLSAFSCQISGIDPLNPEGQCLGADPATGKLGFVDNKGGAIGFLTDSISMTYQIPISSGQYIAALTDRFGIAKPALAQAPGGYGFNSLLPVLPLWEAMRNIVYIFFVLIFVLIGIGIMFRLKIDPRSVMTIQSSLPKIVVGLILVTLSYAIAGFLVDMMYVTMHTTYAVISGATPTREIKNLKPGDVQDKNPFYAAGAIYDENPIVGLPRLTQDAALGAVGILKNAAGIGDMEGLKLTDEEKKRLNASGKDGSDDPPTVTGTFASIFDRIPDVIVGVLDKFPSIGIGPFSTSLFTDLGGKLLSAPFKLTSLLLEGVSKGEQLIVSKGPLHFDNSGGDTMLGRIIRTVSVIGGVYSGIQIGQWNFAAGVRGEAGLGAGAEAECSGICSGPIGAAVGALVIAPLIDSFLRTTLPNLIGFFIILGIVITALLKLWFQLIKSYIYVLLYVILAPFWIAFGLIPGATSAGFTPWIRGLIANLAVFPVTYAMLLFAKILTEQMKNLGGFTPPIIGTQDPSLFASIFGIAILLAIPEILNTVKTALKVPSGKVGQSVGGGIGAGVGFTRAAVSPATTRLMGHKNPVTGKPEGGILPAVGKNIGQNIATKLSPNIAGNPNSFFRRALSQVTMHPTTRADRQKEAQKEAQREANTKQDADTARQNAIQSALRHGQNPTQEPIADINKILDENNIAHGPDMSPEEKLNAIKTHAQTHPAESSLAAKEIARDKHPLQELLKQFRKDLEAIARRKGTTITPDMNLQALLEAVNEGPIASATASSAAEEAVNRRQRAQDLIDSASTGGVPGSMTPEIEAILKAYGISPGEDSKIIDLIGMLNDRVKAESGPKETPKEPGTEPAGGATT